MPNALYQGNVQVPLFRHPNASPKVNPTFNPIADWAVIDNGTWNVRNTTIGTDGTYGYYYDEYILTPFNIYRVTNNAGDTVLGTTNQINCSPFVDGNMYVCNNNGGVGTAGLFFSWVPFSFTNNVRPTIAMQYTATLYDKRPSTNYSYFLLSGRANFNPFQTLFGVSFSFFQTPTLQCSFWNKSMAPQLFTGFTFSNNFPGANMAGNQILSFPDTDLGTTHIVGKDNNGFLWNNWCGFFPANPTGTIIYDDSRVMVDNGISATFQAWFNGAASGQVNKLKRAPNGWLIQLNNSAPGTSNFFLLFNANCTKYWSLTFNIAGSIPLIPGFNQSVITDAFIDATGVAYVSSNYFNPNTIIAHSYGFNLAWYPLTFPLFNAPNFNIPCPPPCNSGLIVHP